MAIKFYIKMKPDFDTFELYNKVKEHEVSVTVLEDCVWIYGKTDFLTYSSIMYQCCFYSSPIESILYLRGE